MKFFSEEEGRGYDEEDRRKVDDLEIGESVPLDAHPFGYFQWILRVHDVEHEEIREDEW
jgi:hypothetical protein